MQSVVQRSFAGGELAPALHARADSVKYATGLRTCRNFFVRKEGGVSNRAGLRYVATAKDNADNKFLLRYESASAGGSVLIEAGNGYLRFFLNEVPVTVSGVAAWSGATNYVVGDLVLSGGVNYYCILAHINHVPANATYWYALTADIYEIPHPFADHQFNWVQSGTVITLTHADVHPQELEYLGLTNWVITPISTVPTIDPPTSLAWTPGVPGPFGGRPSWGYIVTAAADGTYEESDGSTPSILLTGVGEPTPLLPNVLTWTAPTQTAAEFYIYCDPYGNDIYGFIGTAVGAGAVTFSDIGFVPDFNVTPPMSRALFASTSNYPHVAAYFQQRRFFGRTDTVADGIWGSRTGFHDNFGISSPLQDDDSLTFRIVGNQQQSIRFLLGLKSLIVLTSAGEWTVGQPQVALTPSSLVADQELYIGSHDKKPVVIAENLIYLQARGSIVREAKFKDQLQVLTGRDLTIYSTHLFEGYTISRMDYQQTPHSVLWAVRGDGTLLGLTYVPEEDVWGWHRHDTYTNLPGSSGHVQSTIEDVCVVPESNEDGVYLLVKRTIGGSTVRYIERLAPRRILSFNTDAFFVDSGVTFSGAPSTTFTGLGHLEGQVVAVLGDGVVVFDGDPTAASAGTYTVTAGAITLPSARSVVHIGLPIRFAEIETLDLDVQGSAIRDKRKRVQSITALVETTSHGFFAGPDATHLIAERPKPWAASAGAVTEGVEIALTCTWSDSGRVLIRQTNPLPLTILGLIPSVEMGG